MRAGAQAAVGITGFAGPSADPGYNVGHVCFGFYCNGGVTTKTEEFGNIGRNAVREKAAFFAAENMLEIITSG